MNKWKLKDVILMAILGVVFAAVYHGRVLRRHWPSPLALTPLGLSAFGFETHLRRVVHGRHSLPPTSSASLARR